MGRAPPTPCFTVTYSSLYGVEASWTFPHPVGRFIGFIHIWVVMLVELIGVASGITRRHRPIGNSLVFWLL